MVNVCSAILNFQKYVISQWVQPLSTFSYRSQVRCRCSWSVFLVFVSVGVVCMWKWILAKSVQSGRIIFGDSGDLSHELWFTTPQFRYTILNVKCFSIHRKERLRFDSMCKFSVLCVLGSVCSVASQRSAEVFWRRRHVECVLCRRLRCAITCALLQLEAFYCLVVHLGVAVVFKPK